MFQEDDVMIISPPSSLKEDRRLSDGAIEMAVVEPSVASDDEKAIRLVQRVNITQTCNNLLHLVKV